MLRTWKKYISLLVQEKNDSNKLNILEENMQLKSKIQQIQEQIAKKHQFVEGLEYIMDKYVIKDSVFVFNGRVTEACNGYFEVESEYETLMEAMKNADTSKGIRIINNEKFQVGSVRQFISECGEGQVFDLERC